MFLLCLKYLCVDGILSMMIVFFLSLRCLIWLLLKVMSFMSFYVLIMLNLLLVSR